MEYDNYRKIAKEMITAGVKAADPTQAVFDNVKLSDNILTVADRKFDMKDYDKVLLFGIGKACSPMAKALENILKPDDGLLITKIGEEIGSVDIKSVPVYKAYHPEPKMENIKYSKQILEQIKQLDPTSSTLVLFLITGGGSALFCAPPEGITIDDMFKLNQLLMKCGANITDINIIRKHLSQVKGGRFGQLCSQRGATTISLILSDVVGDDLSVIASGPCYCDKSTFEDAINLAKKYGIWDELPDSISDHLLKGLEDKSMEPPREVPENVYNYLVGNNMGALKASEKIAKEAGFNTMILTSQNTGEAKVVAKTIMGIAKEIQDSCLPISPPAALIMGGEMIVTFDWEDRDGFGPNREFVLSSAIEIADRNNIVIAGVDSDGVDGDGKAGAIADCETIKRTKLDAENYLNKHDAELFFDELGDSIEFSSFTNVNDIVVVLIGGNSVN